MTKIYCDRCGKEINGGGTNMELRFKIPGTINHIDLRRHGDVCINCYKEIIAFFENPRSMPE